MKSEDLLSCIENIDPGFIEDAESAVKTKPHKVKNRKLSIRLEKGILGFFLFPFSSTVAVHEGISVINNESPLLANLL